jgi:hypothetical protein
MAEQALTNLHTDGGMHGRKAERFVVSRPARVLSINPALAGISIRSCHLLDISRVGATLSLVTTIGLGDHYYLNVMGTANRIGCAEIYRNGSRVGVKFIKEVDDELLHTIVRGDFFTQSA